MSSYRKASGARLHFVQCVFVLHSDLHPCQRLQGFSRKVPFIYGDKPTKTGCLPSMLLIHLIKHVPFVFELYTYANRVACVSFFSPGSGRSHKHTSSLCFSPFVQFLQAISPLFSSSFPSLAAVSDNYFQTSGPGGALVLSKAAFIKNSHICIRGLSQRRGEENGTLT